MVCPDCFEELDPKFIRFKVNEYKATAIYEYNDFVKKLIYQYKGCYDYELNEVFLNLYFRELGLRYRDYVVVPIPSFIEDDKQREFNHVVEAFKFLKLETLNLLEKTSHFKQANNTAKKRKEIRKHLRLKETISLEKKKVLIVDDIYTTGATMKAAISLIEKLNPKKIEVLVLAKTKDKKTSK